jgi:hypothetical protein
LVELAKFLLELRLVIVCSCSSNVASLPHSTKNYIILKTFSMEFDLTTRETFWNTLFGGLVLWGTYVGLNQSCIQRIVSVPSKTHARWAITLFCIGFVVIMSLNCFTGLVMYAHYHDCDPIKLKVYVHVWHVFFHFL